MKKGLIAVLFLVLIVSHFLLLAAFERQRGITGLLLRIFQTPALIQSLGEVALGVLGKFSVIIYSPQPITYFNQTLDLNVSADTEVASWWFTLKGGGKCSIVYDTVGFVPNISFTSARGQNELTVFARSSSGEIENASVLFNVSAPNLAPHIYINDSFTACEGGEFSVFFDVADDNLDCPDVALAPSSGPFFVFVHSTSLNASLAEFFSGILGKADVGAHYLNITANDGENIDLQPINITVLPVNHAPIVAPILVTTFEIFNNANLSFFTQVAADDSEDGDSGSGNLVFNSTFLSGRELFIINSSYGFINFSYNTSDVGVYSAWICVADQGLNSPESLLACNEDGAPKTTCFAWNFAITYVNRPPNITDYGNTKTGRALSLDARVGELVLFNISAIDPDGNIPYIDWYFDTAFRRRNQTNYDEFLFFPSLADVGEHKLFGVATDLMLNDTVIWNITIIGPSVPSSEGGGGGGSGGLRGAGGCVEKWGCTEWSTCQNASLSSGSIRETCKLFNLSQEYCGFQLRRCVDTKVCKSESKKPRETQVCYFTLFPNCNDGILNCHDNSCELLTDCGGPCSPCPTCSDEKRNQGEENIDCGGPCPQCFEVPFFDIKKRLNITINLFLFLLLLLLAFILYEILRIRRLRQQYGKKIKKIVKSEV